MVEQARKLEYALYAEIVGDETKINGILREIASLRSQVARKNCSRQSSAELILVAIFPIFFDIFFRLEFKFDLYSNLWDTL